MAPTDQSQADACKGRILFAEDSPVTQDLIKLLMLQRGHQVDLAETGAEAVERAKANTYSIVALDFNLPEMDGLTAALKIANTKARGVRPWLVAVTGDLPSLMAKGEDCLVFDRVMPKPTNASQICDAFCQLAGETPPDDYTLPDRAA